MSNQEDHPKYEIALTAFNTLQKSINERISHFLTLAKCLLDEEFNESKVLADWFKRQGINRTQAILSGERPSFGNNRQKFLDYDYLVQNYDLLEAPWPYKIISNSYQFFNNNDDHQASRTLLRFYYYIQMSNQQVDQKYEIALAATDALSKSVNERINHFLQLAKSLSDGEIKEPTVLADWFKCQGDSRTQAILSGERPSFGNNRQKFLDYDYLIQNYDLLEAPWPYKITESFLASTLQHGDYRYALIAMHRILHGRFYYLNFGYTRQIEWGYKLDIEDLQQGQLYLDLRYTPQQVLIFEIGIDKIPIVRDNQLQGFKFQQAITFFSKQICYSHSERTCRKVAQVYQDQLLTLPHRQFNDDLEFTLANNKALSKADLAQYKQYLISLQDKKIFINNYTTYRETMIWQPLKILDQKLAENEKNKFFYSCKYNTWIASEERQILIQKRQAKMIDNQKRKLVKKFGDFSRARKLVELIEKIPNFSIKLTIQQKEVIGAQGNISVIGRSGTGKTTCAILRLFSMEMLFKLRIAQSQEQQIDKFDDNHGLHCVFVTASPVLMGEIKSYYNKCTQQIRTELLKKKIKDQQRQNLEQSAIDIVDYDKYLQSQIQEIILQKQQENELNIDFEKEQEQFLSEMDQYKSFKDMQHSDYPAFFTIRKLLLMLDATLQQPFFRKQNIKRQPNQIYWEDRTHEIWSISKNLNTNNDANDIDGEDLSYTKMALMNIARKNNLTSKIHIVQQQTVEVDYPFFLTKFWPTLSSIGSRQLKGITPSYLWSQIYSHIKGSIQAAKSRSGYISRYTYTQLYSDELGAEKAYQIYTYFERYLTWKQTHGHYDLLDLVHHIRLQIKGQHIKNYIHHLMVDEVQDLPPAILLLLCQVTKENVFFSGDTVQNIANGVGFKFSDLKQLISSEVVGDEFSTHHLSINFRSHNNILQLANSLVTLLEIFSPKTIDKLAKERSDSDGPKPIIVKYIQDLIELLNGSDQLTQPIEFGCNQVIIVQNQESKEAVPLELQYAQILTIQEAKGLEFDDVILFNFFSQQDSQWGALLQLQIMDREIDKDLYEQMITRHSEIKEEDQDQNFYKAQQQQNKVLVKKIVAPPQLKQENYLTLCNQLKKLYVAVTRPKQRLIIYDVNHSQSKYMIDLWTSLDLVEHYRHTAYIKKQGIANKTNPIEWRKQGIRMLAQKYYDQAIKCFQLSKDYDLEQKSTAFNLAAKATQISLMIEQLKKQKKTSTVKQKIKDQTRQQQEIYKQAADIFADLNLMKHAAQCYYSGGYYQDALQIYIKNEFWIEAAETSFNLKQFQRAGDYFIKAQDYMRAIEAYDNCENYTAIVAVLEEYKDKIDNELRITYLNQFIPMILQEFTEQVTDGDDNELKSEQNQIQPDTQVIYENIQEDSAEESDVESEECQEGDDNQVGEETQVEVEEVEEEFEIDAEIIEAEEQQNLNESESFQVESINDKSQSFQIENLVQVPFIKEDFTNILQDYDPDDEWLKSDNQSILELNKSDNSDFSILSYGQILSNPGLQLVRTRGNIFIQDSVIQKLIKLIAVFSNDFKDKLVKIRNQSTKLTAQDQVKQEEVVEYILDMDQIDIQFVYLMLDILEEYKAYKLCILICNKYKLADKLGRYLVLIASSYSNIINDDLTQKYFQDGAFRYQQIQKGMIASYAIHNVFETINPEFLRQKFEEDKLTSYNSFSKQSYQQLILLGYWKKCVYQVDIATGLAICHGFMDTKNWKFLYYTNKVHKLQIQGDPVQLLIAEKQLQNCMTQNFELLSAREDELELDITILEEYYKIQQSHFSQGQNIPKLFSQSANVIGDLSLGNNNIGRNHIEVLISNWHSGTKVQKYEATYLIILIFSKIRQATSMLDILINIEQDIYFKLIETLFVILNSKDVLIQKAKLFVFQCRQLFHEIFSIFQDNYILHRSSPIVHHYVKHTKQSDQNNCSFIDLQLEYVILPQVYVDEYIITNIKTALKVLSHKRIQQSVLSTEQSVKSVSTNFLLQYLVCIDQQKNSKIRNSVKTRNLNEIEKWQQLDQQEQLRKKKIQIQQQLEILDEQYEVDDLDEQITNERFLISNKNTAVKQLENQLLKNLLYFNQPSQLPGTIRTQLLAQVFKRVNKLTKDPEINHKYIIQTILLFQQLDLNQYSAIWLTKKYPIYLKYLEYLVCKQYNCLDDAINCYLEYHEQGFQLMYPDEILMNLTSLMIDQLISSQKDLILTNAQQDNFIKNRLFQQIHCSDYIDDTLYLIHQALGRSNQLHTQYLILMITFILNYPSVSELGMKYMASIQQILDNRLLTYLIQNTLDKSIYERRSYYNDYRLKIVTINADLEFLPFNITQFITKEESDNLYNKCLLYWEELFNTNKKYVQVIETNYLKYKQREEYEFQKVRNFREKEIGIRRSILKNIYENQITNLSDFLFLSKQLELIDECISTKSYKINELNQISKNLQEWEANYLKDEERALKQLAAKKRQLQQKWESVKAGVRIESKNK